jgi:hypothetical protein
MHCMDLTVAHDSQPPAAEVCPHSTGGRAVALSVWLPVRGPRNGDSSLSRGRRDGDLLITGFGH